MREILFRGKRVSDGEWLYGNYAKCEAMYNWKDVRPEPRTWIQAVDESSVALILDPVDPATVGQFTGMTDKNGKRIFEGDIVLFKWDKEHNYCHIIEFVDGEFCATPVTSRDDTWQIRICGENEKFSVIGNIHDNPELMEVQECH